MAGQVVLGLDLGGINMVGAALTASGELLARSKIATEVSGGRRHVIDRMADCLLDVLAECGSAREDVAAAGVGAPGPLNQETGVVYTPPNLPGWKDVPLADELRTRLNLPVFIENDANCAAYGENWLGAGRNFKDLICLTLGTGIGGGIILNNELVRGIDGTAGEIGHMIVEIHGRKCHCGSYGCRTGAKGSSLEAFLPRAQATHEASAGRGSTSSTR